MAIVRTALVYCLFVICIGMCEIVFDAVSNQTMHGQDVQRASAQPAESLNTALADLERVSAATENDIANLRAAKPHSGWKTAWMFWRKNNSQGPQAGQMAESLQKNLRDAMPGLIHDAQNSSGISATFKLYNNLSVVCESLDLLVEATKSGGKTDGPLSYDSAAMGRIRQELAAYVEQSAAALDAKAKSYTSAAPATATGKPRKIVVDEPAPEKKTARKKTPGSQ